MWLNVEKLLHRVRGWYPLSFVSFRSSGSLGTLSKTLSSKIRSIEVILEVILFSQLCLMRKVYFVTLNVYLRTKFVCHPLFYLSLIITIIHHELYQWLSNLSLLLISLVIVFYIMAIIDVATEIAQCSRKYFG